MKKWIALLICALVVMSAVVSCDEPETDGSGVTCVWLDKGKIDPLQREIPLSESEQESIRQIVGECSWEGEVADCGYDFEITIGDGVLLYCLNCGTLVKKQNGACENLNEEQQAEFEALLQGAMQRTEDE